MNITHDGVAGQSDQNKASDIAYDIGGVSVRSIRFAVYRQRDNAWMSVSQEEAAHRRRAAQLGEAAFNVALVARKHHRDARLLMRGDCRSRHFALPPVHYLVAARKGRTAAAIIQRLAQLVAARKRRLRTSGARSKGAETAEYGAY